MTQQPPASEPATPIDQDSLSVEQLARTVLDRALRPRVGSVRRLAEAVLAAAVPKAKKGKEPKKPKKDSGKKKKLARIPGQKS